MKEMSLESVVDEDEQCTGTMKQESEDVAVMAEDDALEDDNQDDFMEGVWQDCVKAKEKQEAISEPSSWLTR